ncbi:hypothetical protein TNCV_2522461 [Trichonephila clavipes]|nr:hypothetical protein TNCV_2522461 [Trichonephila clavipes]
MREKCGNRLVSGSDYMVDALKLLNQASRVSGESLQSCGAWLCPDGIKHIFYLPILRVSGQQLTSNHPTVDSRNLNLKFGQKEATHNKLFFSIPTKYTIEPSRPLDLLEKLWLDNERIKGLTSTPETKVSILELTKVVSKFEMKDGDIVLFLDLSEQQAKMLASERHWAHRLQSDAFPMGEGVRFLRQGNLSTVQNELCGGVELGQICDPPS